MKQGKPPLHPGSFRTECRRRSRFRRRMNRRQNCSIRCRSPPPEPPPNPPPPEPPRPPPKPPPDELPPPPPRRRRRSCCRHRSRHRTATAAAFAATADHLQLAAELTEHDLGGVLVVAFLILPLAGLELAFDVDLATALQVAFRHVGQTLVKNHHAMPFGLLALLAASRSRQRSDVAMES